ncbi:MAG: hypothetical protein AAF573_11145 [Bacteroidota bacterium]
MRIRITEWLEVKEIINDGSYSVLYHQPRVAPVAIFVELIPYAKLANSFGVKTHSSNGIKA